MNKKEKEVLKKAVQSKDGQISPANMIEGYAGGDQGLVERLVSQGYLERVYQFREGLRQATYSIIFYAVTEKGYVQFASFPERIWFAFKNNVAIWVGVSSIVIGAVSILFSGLSYSANNISAAYRPYIGIEKIEIVKEDSRYNAKTTIINTGAVPANNLQVSLSHFVDGKKLVDTGTAPLNSAFLMPAPANLIYRFHGDPKIIDGGHDWTIELTFKYDGVTSSGHETRFSGRYDPINNSFNIFQGYAN